MATIYVLLFCMFWCEASASQLSLDSMDESETEHNTSKGSVITPTTQTLNLLKGQRHRLRMRLETNVRTRSSGPPSGEIRRKTQEALSKVERTLKDLNQPHKK